MMYINSGHDNECCYDANSKLKETDGNKFGSIAQRYHYKGGIQNVPYLSNIMDDVIPYMYCCQYPSEFQLEDNGQCKRFMERRPASRCEGYVPPRPAFIYGILHFVTLDGLKYTFNGVGEFTALETKDQSLRIQVRAEQLKDHDGKLKNGSVATSVALQCGGSSDIVEVRLNSIRVSDVLVNHKQLDFEDRTTVDIKGSTIIRDRSKKNSSDETVWTLVSCSDPEIAVNVTAITNLMSIIIIVGDEKLRGNLSGLLGNYNGRADDDFTTPTGRQIPIDSSLDVIHAQFGITWQITPASNSLFTYAVGTSYDTFKNPNFKPTTMLADKCKRKAAALCGGDETCQFDFCISDDLDIIIFSRQMSNERQELEKVALPPCGQPKDVHDGHWELGVQSANLVCDDNYAANNVTEITCLPGGQWEDFITTCEAIPVVAEPIVADPGVPVAVVGGLMGGIVLLILGMILFIIFLKRTGRLQPARERVTAGLRTIRNTVRRLPAYDKTHLSNEEEDTYYYDGMNLKGDHNMTILKEDIALESVLAQGKFATIYLAKYYGHRQIPNLVAAKALKENHNQEDIAKMISKINFFAMKVGHHKNILDFFGSVEDDDVQGPMMILEYCSNGPLKDYLSSIRSQITIDVQERLYRITFAICNGMEYLASKKIVHRKLAARNILLDQYLEPKIIGFGPEPQQTDEDETTTEKLPIKWMAPECTKTTKNANELSDVWSYGIVMWEIFSLGDTPYPGMHSKDVPNELKKGHKMAKPEYCDDTFYQVMKGCWRYYAKDRQRFAQIKKQLDNMFTEGPDDECYYQMN